MAHLQDFSPDAGPTFHEWLAHCCQVHENNGSLLKPKAEPTSFENEDDTCHSEGSQSEWQYQDECCHYNPDIILEECVAVGQKQIKRELDEGCQPQQTSTLASLSPSSSSNRAEVVSQPRCRCSLGMPAVEKSLEADSGSEIDDDDDNDEDLMAVGHVRRDTNERRKYEMNEKGVNDVKHGQIRLEDEEVNAGVESQGEKDEWMHEEISEEENGGEDFFWLEDFSSFTGQKETYRRDPGPTFSSADPAEIFLKFWDVSIMNIIAQETNRYAAATIAQLTDHNQARIPQYLKSWTEIGVEDLYRYFAMLIFITFCQRSKLQEYWTTGRMEMSGFKMIMSRNTFLLITKFLHFVDNKSVRGSTGPDRKIKKVRPVLDHCNRVFSQLYTPGQYLSLDESLLHCKVGKGPLSWRQYIKTNAARFGIKSFELCDADTGYLLKCLLYTGKETAMPLEPVHGFTNKTAKVVLQLMEGFLDVGHVLVMDSWYNQLPLTRFLKTRNTDVLGTIANSRKHVPQIIKDLNPNKTQRGTVVARHCGDISLVTWKDVKLVTVLSTYHSHEMVTGRRAGQAFQKPSAVAEYNRYMGGVDLKDQKLSMFLFERKRGHKYYMKVFKRLFNTSLLNAFIIYTKQPTHRLCSHRNFRYLVAEGLVNRFSRVEQQPSLRVATCTSQPLRLQVGDHFPEHTEPTPGTGNSRHKRLDCVRCVALKKRSRVVLQCALCKVALCVGQCWREYHECADLSKTS